MGAHIMIDLETFGTAPGSALRSIGAVVFDPVTGHLGETFYRNIKRASCEAAGLTVDPQTEAWWSRQSLAARAALDVDPRAIGEVLGAFAAFCDSARDPLIWGHGGNFDEPLLSAAYRAVGMPPPWKYWNGRCTRTIYDAAGVKPDRAAGVHHNALDDARNQALAVHAAYVRLGLGMAA